MLSTRLLPRRGLPLAHWLFWFEAPTAVSDDTRFDGQRAYGYLKQLCEFGNRMSGSRGMQQQQELLEKHFSSLDAKVTYQRFEVKHPLNGKRVPMANMIIEWRPEAQQRLLLCAHYDTRPLPDRELNPRTRQTGVFLGANDGASGVSLLMEMGHHVAGLPNNYGLDFVMFDGEELVYFDGNRDVGRYFHGSIEFSQQYRQHPPQYQYFAGVLFDMVADAKLSVYQERFSATWSQTRPPARERDLGHCPAIGREGVHPSRKIRSSRRPPAAQSDRQNPRLRRDRFPVFRLPQS